MAAHVGLGHQPAIDHGERQPVIRLFEDPAQATQLVLHQERHDVGHLDRLLLGVGEAGHALALHERLALDGDLVEHGRRMTDGGHRLAGGPEGLDQRDRVGVVHQVPHRAVAAGIEDGVEVVRRDRAQLDRIGQDLLGRRVVLEPDHRLGLLGRVIAPGIDGRLPALGRGQGHLSPGVGEDVVGRGELLQPEPRLLAGVSQYVVGCENHQDFHEVVPFSVGPRARPGAAPSSGARWRSPPPRSVGTCKDVETRRPRGHCTKVSPTPWSRRPPRRPWPVGRVSGCLRPNRPRRSRPARRCADRWRDRHSPGPEVQPR